MTLSASVETTAHASSETSFHDLMAGVGYLLFQWSLMERSLDEEIGALRRAAGDVATGPTRLRTVNERLGEWRALLGRGRRRNAAQYAAAERLGEQVQDYLRLRNLVATGFASATIDGPQPMIRCAVGQRGGAASDEVGFTLDDLLAAIDGMEGARAEMALLRVHELH